MSPAGPIIAPKKELKLDVENTSHPEPPKKKQKLLQPTTSVRAAAAAPPVVSSKQPTQPEQQPAIRYRLPSWFGVNFFRQCILGVHGSISQPLADKYGVQIRLRGKLIPDARGYKYTGDDLLFVDIILAGGNSKTNNSKEKGGTLAKAKKCRAELEKSVYDACHHSFRGHLMCNLAVLNQDVTTRRFGIVHAPLDPHNQKRLFYMTFVKLGQKAQPDLQVADVSLAKKHVKTLQQHHPSCHIEIRSKTRDEHPNVMPHVFIHGKSFDDVFKCREEINKIGGIPS